MKKAIVSSVVAIGMVTSVSVPTFAGEVQETLGNRQAVQAGFYLRLPFNGGLERQTQEKFSYGLRAGIRHDYRTSTSFLGERMTWNADLLQLKFGTRGFDNFAIGGRNVISYNQGRLGLFTNADGSLDWLEIALAGAAIGAATWGIIQLLEDDEADLPGDP